MKRAYEFAMVRAQGSSQAGRFLVLSLCPQPRGKVTGTEGVEAAEEAVRESRFGIITTKRLGHAVTRVLLRRRVREILRQHGEPLAKGFYVVVIPRYTAAKATYAELEKDFQKLLRRALPKQKAAAQPAQVS